MGAALMKIPISGVIIPAGGGRAEFPIVVADGALMDDDARDVAPFVIIVNWRKTRAMWLPQPPNILFSSARSLRRLNQAETGKRPLSD
jgi:hypothetical protein